MSSNFRDLIALLNKHNAKYLIVGGYAVMYYSEPRYTKDLDVVIGISPDNARRVVDVMREFGIPIAPDEEAELTKPKKMIMMGSPPERIDILTTINGIDFETAWERRTLVPIGGEQAAFISREDLILAKRASGRPQDLLDLSKLEPKGDL